jgi:preprotein translocase SecE subunit
MPTGAFFRIKDSLFDISSNNQHNMNSFITYLKETRAELKEVVFPTATQTITFTLLVIIISLLVATTLGGVDLGLREGLTKILDAKLQAK